MNIIIRSAITALLCLYAISLQAQEQGVVTTDTIAELEEVTVKARRLGTIKPRHSVFNEERISSEELTRAACCNLGESFTTNPSVDVNYSDAATGAKQVKLLGLAGTYVQMLSENIPNYRGAASPFALGYIPGPWMQSIQVSKGASSVKNGYEAITGQINVEFKKPQDIDQDVNLNLYLNSKLRYEANADANIHLNERLSTSVLAHYENMDRGWDHDEDGFLDMPRMKQYNLQNRWAWMGDKYVFQASLKALKEERRSGQTEDASSVAVSPLYRIGIDTERYEAFAKNAYIFDKAHNTNLALILSGTYHQQDAVYGHRFYDVKQTNGYAQLLFETDFSPMHKLAVGASLNYDRFDQRYQLNASIASSSSATEETASVSREDASLQPTFSDVRETVSGAYAQYTFNLQDKLVVMGGVRMDYSSLYGAFVTPRLHVRYSPADAIVIRASAGKGYRTPHALAENHYLLASGRKITLADDLQQESAWNYGISSTFYLPLGEKQLTLNAEYYYTDFSRQMVVDRESAPGEIRFANLQGDSYSQVVQVDATYPLLPGLQVTAAYRWTDVRTTYDGQLMERPLTGRYKGMFSASYKTPMEIWQFDATLQLNGGGRMPKAYTLADGSPSWGERYQSFEQLSAQITRHFRHWSLYVGGENLTNYTQKHPIMNASNPWSDNFDSTLVWGPMDGITVYAGVRIKI